MTRPSYAGTGLRASLGIGAGGCSGEPRYTRGAQPSEVWAQFPSGVAVAAKVGRQRAYPGLNGQAPSTLAIYATVRPATGERRSALDAGCGAGVGTRELCRHFEPVFGVDFDSRAIAFARQYAPSARYRKADLCKDHDLGSADLVTVVDVLGHVGDPVVALRHLRRTVTEGGTLLVAEPTAHAAQGLRAPVLRAFSKQELQTLLVRSGFAVSDAIEDHAQFHTLLAEPSRSTAWRYLVQGDQAFVRGSVDEALSAFERAIDVGSREVQVVAVAALAEVYAAHGRKDEAVSALSMALELDPNHADALAALSRVLLETRADDALELALEALRADPGNAQAAWAHAEAARCLNSVDAEHARQAALNLSLGGAGVRQR